MLLSFFDIFKFFSEVEFTDEIRKYELVGVSVICAVSLALTVTGIVRNNRKHGEKKDEVE